MRYDSKRGAEMKVGEAFELCRIPAGATITKAPEPTPDGRGFELAYTTMDGALYSVRVKLSDSGWIVHTDVIESSCDVRVELLPPS